MGDRHEGQVPISIILASGSELHPVPAPRHYGYKASQEVKSGTAVTELMDVKQ